MFYDVVILHTKRMEYLHIWYSFCNRETVTLKSCTYCIWINKLKKLEIGMNKVLKTFSDISRPRNKWCLDWSGLQNVYPIPIFDIIFLFPIDFAVECE